MKKFILTLMLAVAAAVQTMALTRSRSMEEASFLTDKMTYELGLSQMQADDVYQINYDYFTQVGYSTVGNVRAADIRMQQLAYVLTPTQFRLCQTVSYFLTPAVLQNGQFYFHVYNFYTRGHYYYVRPTVYQSYRGAYLNNVNYYQTRRPTGYYYHNGQLVQHPGSTPPAGQSYRGGNTPPPAVRPDNRGGNTPPPVVNNGHNDRGGNTGHNNRGANTSGNNQRGNSGHGSTGGTVTSSRGGSSARTTTTTTTTTTTKRGTGSSNSSRFSGGGTTRRGR